MHLHYFTKKLSSSVIFGFAILKSFISVSVLVVINNSALDMTGKAIFHSSNNEIISLYRAHIAYSVRISVYAGHELLRVLRLGGYWRHQSRDVWRHCDVGEEEISRWYMTPGWSITWRRRTTATAELQGCARAECLEPVVSAQMERLIAQWANAVSSRPIWITSAETFKSK